MKRDHIYGLGRLAALVLTLCFALALAGCGKTVPAPGAGSCVADQAGVLDDETEAAINQYTGALQAACGAQVGVLTVSDTQGGKLSELSKDALKAWGLGDAKKKNGVLLVLYTGGKGDYHCVTGKGLEKTLPSSEIKTLLNTYLEPGFASGDYSGGVRDFTEQVVNRIAAGYQVTLDLNRQGDASVHPERIAKSTTRKLLILTAVFVLIFIATLCMAMMRPAPKASQAKSRSSGSRPSQGGRSGGQSRGGSARGSSQNSRPATHSSYSASASRSGQRPRGNGPRR